MSKINILHLSDLHISIKDRNIKKEIIKKLIDDCNNVVNSQVNIVIITGDLVSSGTKENFDIATEIIEYISNKLNVEYENIIYIPGNHEVDIQSIKSYYFSGLQQDNNRDAWEQYSFNKDTDLCHQMKNYINFKYAVNFKNDIITNKFYDINNLKIGITAINSAWFSKGKTSDDRDRIFIPSTKIKNYFSKLEDCQLKIAVLHHPYNNLKYEYINDVEKELGKYDLVLCGHTHDDNIKTITNIPGNKAAFITGNEIKDSTNNGYAIYSVSLEEQKIFCQMRKYHKKRETFDLNNEILENGIFVHELNNISKHEKILYELFTNTKNKFKDNLDSLMITNVLDTNLNNSFSTSFIPPKLTIPNTENEYETDRNEICFEDLLNDRYERIILTGKKEVGKTVFANYIALYYYDHFNEFKKIPIVINCENIKKNFTKNYVTKIKEILNSYTSDEYSVSNSKINTLIENDSLVLIFDDHSKDDIELLDFITNFNSRKIYILMEETITTIPFLKTKLLTSMVDSKSNILTVRIEEFTKNQIRKYSKLLLQGTKYNVDQLCSKTVLLFNEMSLPKTPFAVSLFISICSINSDFEPTNKSKIIEKLIEILLEKLSHNDIYLKSYGFDSKCSFLSELAYDMYLKNQYYYNINEFIEFVANYHKKKMFPLDDTKFDRLFFEKNILIKKNDVVMFRFKCFINYFLALFFSKHHSEMIELAKSEKYYNYDELFEYYSGINKNSKELAQCIVGKFIQLENDIPNLDDILNLKLLKTELFNNISEEKINNLVPLCDEEKDLITDRNISSDYDPTKIDTTKEIMETEKLLRTIYILGSIIKNSEDYMGEDKIKYLKTFMNGCICITAKIYESFKNMIFELKEKIIAENNSESIKEQKLEKLFDGFNDVVKLTIPLVVQEFILETVGTRKLKTVIEQIINDNCKIDLFEYFNYICLYSDLRIENWEKLFIKFINQNKNYNFYSLIILKCFGYLRMDYFNDNSKSCKEVLMKIYELHGYSKNKANNIANDKIKKITFNINN